MRQLGMEMGMELANASGNSSNCRRTNSTSRSTNVCVPLSFNDLGFPVAAPGEWPCWILADGYKMPAPFGMGVSRATSETVLAGGKFL
eukprot:5119152-Pyramimonas_sp.AAC.1